MSIGSIGSIRGALSSVEAQASLNTPRVNVRNREDQAPERAAGVPAPGGGFAAPSQPWAAWPPYIPPPPIEDGVAGGTPTAPAIPLPNDTKDSELVVKPQPPAVREGLVIDSLPPPRPEGDLVVKPQPPAVREGLVIDSLPLPRPEGDLVVAPLPVPVPRPPVEDEPAAAPLPPPGDQGGSGNLVAAPLPPPGRPATTGGPVNPGAPVLPAIPLPVEASGFATPSPLVPFEPDRSLER